MPTITESGAFTLLIEFKVAPDQQQALINGVAAIVEAHFHHYPGFVSASFHASDDGRRVVNYAQWHSRGAWERTFSDSTEVNRAVQEVITRCGATPLGVRSFRVARVVDTPRTQQTAQATSAS